MYIVYRITSIKRPPSFKRPPRINAPLFQNFKNKRLPLLNAPSNKRPPPPQGGVYLKHSVISQEKHVFTLFELLVEDIVEAVPRLTL